MDIEVDRHANAISRELVERDYKGKSARVVVVSRSYDTDLDDVWDALTSPGRIPRWFLPITGELRLGGHYQLEGNAGGTIMECDPPRSFALTWEFGGQVSWVYLTLSPETSDRTRLQLEHVAHTDAQFMQFWDQFGPGAVGVGWDLSIMGLAEHLETGASVDHEVAHAWLSTDNGKAFVKASSDGWGQASAKFGTDPTAAQEAAERTTAFYTGDGESGAEG